MLVLFELLREFSLFGLVSVIGLLMLNEPELAALAAVLDITKPKRPRGGGSTED